MATIRIEPPRRHYYIYYRDRAGTQRHLNSGIPHSPEGSTPAEIAERAKENRRLYLALANDLESAERGNKTQAYIKALYTGALQRSMGVYSEDGANGVTAPGLSELVVGSSNSPERGPQNLRRLHKQLW
jgi:hypothetical protein